MAQKNKATLLTEARQLVDVEVDEKLTVPELEAFIAEHTPQRVSVASTAPAAVRRWFSAAEVYSPRWRRPTTWIPTTRPTASCSPTACCWRSPSLRPRRTDPWPTRQASSTAIPTW